MSEQCSSCGHSKEDHDSDTYIGLCNVEDCDCAGWEGTTNEDLGWIFEDVREEDKSRREHGEDV